jgi:uncharacterized damage-inducible protein DinB
MEALPILRTMLHYHVAATRRTWELVQGSVSEEEFCRKLGFSWDSLRNELLHIAFVDRSWLALLRGEADPPDDPFDGFHSVAQARAVAETSLAEVESCIARLTAGELEEALPGLPGTRWQILLHVANHGTDHRGRVICQLKALGKRDFEQDLTLHLRGKF